VDNILPIWQDNLKDIFAKGEIKENNNFVICQIIVHRSLENIGGAKSLFVCPP
jgi:hypothetical protein